MVSIKKETNIKGLPHGIAPDEEDALWGDCRSLRPKDHRRWLAHFIALEFGLSRLLAGWIPACGHLEWKIELPRLLYEHMQRARRLRERLEEITGTSTAFASAEPVVRFLGGIAKADSGASFVSAFLGQIMPALGAAYSRYAALCDEVFDAPTLYILRINQPEVDRTTAWGRQFLAAHPLPVLQNEKTEMYPKYVAAYLAALGGLTPSDFEEGAPIPANPVTRPAGPNPAKRAQDPRLRLAAGFPTTKAGNPTKFSLREIVYHNATEWQVIDPMCEIFYGLANMPMDFFVDFSRHIWDECRHSRMGFRRLIELGYSIEDFEWYHGADRVAVLEDYFAGLTLIGEACSFTRKKGSIPLFLRAGDKESAMLPEVDCSDEQLHVTYGHKWVTKIYEAVKGKSAPRDEIARERRRVLFEELLTADKRTDVKETLEKLDPKTREELVNSFSGFCGAIEFKLDFTVY